METYVLNLRTIEGMFYGGKIRAASVDQADIAAFFIWKGLENEGFERILSVEAIEQYYDSNTNLKVIQDKHLVHNLAYYSLDYQEYVSKKKINELITFFISREEYEKCAKINKYAHSLVTL